MLQRAIFILAGMNFLYTISWKREEESGRIGEGGRRMRRAFSSLPGRLPVRQSGLFGVMTPVFGMPLLLPYPRSVEIYPKFVNKS